MNSTLNLASLIRKYPLSLRDYSDSISTDFQIGAGWEALLNLACQQIEIYLVEQQQLAPSLPLPRIAQIKEKMGSLRINLIPSDDYLTQIRLYALQQSERICENCGSQLKWRGIHKSGCAAAK